MRLIVFLMLALAAIWYVPRLWQRAVVDRALRAANETVLPSEPEIDRQIDSVDPVNGGLKMNPPVVIDTKKYEGADLQHQTDEAIRRSEDLHQSAT